MRTRNGFTLIELLVALATIGLLIAAAAASLQAAQIHSRDSQRISDVATLGKALDGYASANRGKYPTDSAGVECPSAFGSPSQLQAYLSTSTSFPSDPKPATSGNCSNFTRGYKFYANTVGSPANSIQQRYVIVVGLEKTAPGETTSVLPASTTFSSTAIGSSSIRTPYYLPGPYCGLSC